MLFSTLKALALSAIFVSSSALASDINERVPSAGLGLAKRQQFIPTTSTAQGADCVQAFGEGYLTCREKTDTRNRLCYNPTMGDSCCSNQWACPEDSFCLVDPYCCPKGLDAATCASRFGVSLSSSFVPVSTKPVVAAASSPVASSPVASSPVASSPAASTPVAAASSSPSPATYPVPPKNATVSSATVSSRPSASKPAQFTGAASAQGVGFAVAAAGGVFALLGGWL